MIKYVDFSRHVQQLCSPTFSNWCQNMAHGTRCSPIKLRWLHRAHASSCSSSALAPGLNFCYLGLESSPRGIYWGLRHLCLVLHHEAKLFVKVIPCVCYDFQETLCPRIDRCSYGLLVHLCFINLLGKFLAKALHLLVNTIGCLPPEVRSSPLTWTKWRVLRPPSSLDVCQS
jgi:hypothetical protein